MKLLAVDAGLHCGYAMFDIATATLLWYRSHNYGALARLRRGAATLIAQELPIDVVVLEGGGAIADPWRKSAEFHGIQVVQIYAEQWRHDVLYARERRSGASAKRAALAHAQTSMAHAKSQYHSDHTRYDAVEAIMIGEWALQYCEIVRAMQRDCTQRS